MRINNSKGKTQIVITLEPDVFEALEEEANENDESVNEAIERILKDHTGKADEEEEEGGNDDGEEGEEEIENMVKAYKTGANAGKLSPEQIAVVAAAMKPPAGATPEQRHAFENMQKIATGQKNAELDAAVSPIVDAYTGRK